MKKKTTENNEKQPREKMKSPVRVQSSKVPEDNLLNAVFGCEPLDTKEKLDEAIRGVDYMAMAAHTMIEEYHEKAHANDPYALAMWDSFVVEQGLLSALEYVYRKRREVLEEHK